MDLVEVLAGFEQMDRVRIRDAANLAGIALAEYRQGADGTCYIDHKETIVICRTAIMSSVPLPHFVRTEADSRWPWRLDLSGSSVT